jgi:hypothetical protein|uniref:ORF15 n=1 Tax=Nitrosopumilaceae spindle-shaped virus TaxID=3065433 RepID=A0AAT9J9L7_9VIRU
MNDRDLKKTYWLNIRLYDFLEDMYSIEPTDDGKEGILKNIQNVEYVLDMLEEMLQVKDSLKESLR